MKDEKFTPRKPECVVTGKIIDPCTTLDEVTEYENPTGREKGLCFWRYTSSETGKTSRVVAGAKSGKHRKQGMAFNLCPFCGVSFEATLK